MREIHIEEQKRILLDAMVYVDKFCRENGIQYFLIGGTLLGAIRHKGFIPWDDDIDIALLREDYQKLLASFNQNDSGGRYRIVDREKDRKFYLPYAKIIDTTTTLRENVHGIMEIGINIDVFPIDYISDSVKREYGKIVKKSWLETIIDIRSTKISSDLPLWKKVSFILIRGLCPIPFWYGAVIKERRMQKYVSDEPTDWVANLYGAWGEKEITATENIVERTTADFEGCSFSIPTGYDAWLTGVYGDYMTPPPEEKRKSHHDYSVYYR